MQPRSSERGRQGLVWAALIVCSVLAVLVIITGVVVFAVYLIYQPKMPYLHVPAAHLGRLDYDQSGTLGVEMVLIMVAENDNRAAAAGFSDVAFTLSFHGIDVALLRAGPFEVPRNSSLPLQYDARAGPVPLDADAMAAMDAALKAGLVPFDLAGQARTRWRVGLFLPVRLWTHLSCRLSFFWPNGTALHPNCTSRAH
uniref:Uncharacterized protein n=1 Tax=Ananas comosus var. bracteatus TaxID=296719 RepID=A0A6V7P249_ANACO|nr:unnamed protein product [Ananas comosus var. bracteatus]